MRIVTQVALTGMRVVTQDFGRKSKLKRIGRNPNCSYVKSVVTRGSTVFVFNRAVYEIHSFSILSADRSKASSKTVPTHSAI
jgi:hypothetical protein